MRSSRTLRPVERGPAGDDWIVFISLIALVMLVAFAEGTKPVDTNERPRTEERR